MDVKSFMIFQFEEIFKRLEKLDSKIGDELQFSTITATFNTTQTANMLGVTTRTLSNYRKQRQIGFVQVGRKIMFTKANIDEFLGSFKVNSITFKTKSNGRF